MEPSCARHGVDFETTMFFHHFKDLPDHRRARDVSYPLEEILLLTPWRLTRRSEHDDARGRRLHSSPQSWTYYQRASR
jgi:hypothetical protein